MSILSKGRSSKTEDFPFSHQKQASTCRNWQQAKHHSVTFIALSCLCNMFPCLFTTTAMSHFSRETTTKRGIQPLKFAIFYCSAWQAGSRENDNKRIVEACVCRKYSSYIHIKKSRNNGNNNKEHGEEEQKKCTKIEVSLNNGNKIQIKLYLWRSMDDNDVHGEKYWLGALLLSCRCINFFVFICVLPWLDWELMLETFRLLNFFAYIQVTCTRMVETGVSGDFLKNESTIFSWIYDWNHDSLW